jgi:hypothetical protein
MNTKCERCQTLETIIADLLIDSMEQAAKAQSEIDRWKGLFDQKDKACERMREQEQEWLDQTLRIAQLEAQIARLTPQLPHA